MPDLGLLLAIPPAHVAALLGLQGDDDALADYVADVLEPGTPPELTAETDQAWDAIHRSLTDGSLTFGPSPDPLARCILGGRLLSSGEGYLVVLTDAADVPATSAALGTVTEEQFAEGYQRIDPDEYGPHHGPEDLAYAWEWFQHARALWAWAAADGLAVVFTAGQ